MTLLITNFIAAFLLPPLNIILLLLVGIALINRNPKLARAILLVALSLLWIGSSAFFVNAVSSWLEAETVALSKPIPNAQAIVILGGGTYVKAPEYDGLDTADANELLRLRYGARLYRETHIPILVSGGKPLGNDLPEAVQMRRILEQEFNVPVRWLEDQSNTTFENARNSQQILQAAGIKRVLLVTQAVDMRRAADIFRHFGVDVVEAPTIFTTYHHINIFTFMPSADVLVKSKRLSHELIGILWYKIKTATNIP